MGPMRLLRLIGLISLMGLMGCSQDSAKDPDSPRTSIEAVGLAPTFLQAEPATRAVTWPSGYYDYNDPLVMGQFSNQESNFQRTIGVFFAKEGIAEPDEGEFTYKNTTWRTDVNMKAGVYYLYGFIPKEAATSATITPNSSYEDGATLTLNGLSTVTPNDVCVIVGAKEGTGTETVEGLQTGSFLFTAKAGSNVNNYVFLLFDHLYSSLRLRFKVDATYNALRTIKLKKLELRGYDTEGNPTREKATATITLTATDGASPISSVNIVADGTSSATAYTEIFTSSAPEGLELGSDFPEDFIGCFAPALCSSFELRSTYDVYDRKGNLIRQNNEIINKIDIRKIFDISKIFDSSVLRRGEMFTVNLTVNPTYLYVLSEPDLDNPTIKVD